MLYVATARGLIYLERQDGGWREAGGGLDGQALTAIAARGPDLLAGSRDGLYRSADGGQTWWPAGEGLGERHIRSVALHPDEPNLAYAGTEPANIYYSEDGGRSWHERPEVASLRDAGGWYLPYSPRAGAIRGLAFQGRRGYAAAEQGGLLRSDDWGQTWNLVPGSSGQVDVRLQPGQIHPDVHSVLIHPSSPDQVLAPTGGGFYYTANGGRSWDRLHADYCRAVWVDPLRPARLILGTAAGPDRSGRVMESLNGGQAWQPAERDLAVPMADYMVEHFVPSGGELLAVLSNGELIGAAPDGLQWQIILPPAYAARALAVVGD